jgi:hypothetical protein
VSLTWAESPHAHAAQTYLESGDLADSVAAYVAAAPATPTRANSFRSATLRSDGDSWRTMLRKATRTRRLA